MEAVQGEGTPGTIPDEAFEAGAVGGLDADAGIEAEPAAVLPGEHILSLVGLQEAVAATMPQNSGTDGVLETFEKLRGESGSFVEREAGGGIGGIQTCISLSPLEEPVHDAEMEVIVRVQGGAEAVQEAHRAEGG